VSRLDPIIAATIDELISRLRAELGVTEILVSHDVTGIMRMADRIAFLYEGKVRMVGTVSDYRDSTDTIIRQFMDGKTTGPIQVT
jgi:phospholipid/cholesterol/gamma-HCH transport system ATP-binding protein